MMIDTLENGINITIDLTGMGSLFMGIGFMRAILTKGSFMALEEDYAMSTRLTLASLKMVSGKAMEFTQVRLLGAMKEHGKKATRKDLELASFEL